MTIFLSLFTRKDWEKNYRVLANTGKLREIGGSFSSQGILKIYQKVREFGQSGKIRSEDNFKIYIEIMNTVIFKQIFVED